MNKRAAQVMGWILVAGMAQAQDIVITSMQANASIGWTAPSGSLCTIEWTDALGPTTTWHESWSTARGILMTNSAGITAVPMFYRIKCETNAQFMTTPYVSESDIYQINDGYSNTTNCPWGFAHYGIDLRPQSNGVPFQAVCDGHITDITFCRSDGPTGNWDVAVELRRDSSFSVIYNFEPMSMDLADGIAQFTNIAVHLLQEVSQGDIIGYLQKPDEWSHVHLGLWHNSFRNHDALRVESICPGPFLMPEAKASMLNLLHVKYPGANLCYCE